MGGGSSIPCQPCQPCKDEGVVKDGTGFCTDCEPAEVLCDGCVKDHKKNKASKQHDVITVSTYENKADVLQFFNKTFKCRKHTGSTVQFICVTHGQPVCSQCLESAHKGCKASPKCYGGEDLKQMKTLSETVQQNVMQLRKKTENQKKQIEESAKLTTEKRKSVIDDLRRRIDTLNTQLEKETNSLLESELEKISKDVEEIERIEKCNTAYIAVLSNADRSSLNVNKQNLITGEMKSDLDCYKRNTSLLLRKHNAKLEFVEAPIDLVSVGSVVSQSDDYEIQMGSACADDEN